MSSNGINAQSSPTTHTQHRFSKLFTGLALRLLIAFIICLLIITFFFVSGVVSH